MTVEDITIKELLSGVSYNMRMEGIEVFWTPEMPDGPEDALENRTERREDGGGFVNVYSPLLKAPDGSPLFFSFPEEKIMRTAKRFGDGGKRDGFLIAVKARRRLTNALLIVSEHGQAYFQLGLFGRKFIFEKSGTMAGDDAVRG